MHGDENDGESTIYHDQRQNTCLKFLQSNERSVCWLFAFKKAYFEEEKRKKKSLEMEGFLYFISFIEG